MTITQSLIDEALEAAATDHTRRSYGRALASLASWLDGRELSYAVTMAFRAHLVKRKASPQNINQHLSAVRFFLREMAQRGRIEPDAAKAIGAVENLRVRGRKLGNWLSIAQAQSLLDAPDVAASPIAIRDRAVFALLIGAGLRRSEAVSLEMRQFERRQLEDGHSRWVLVGIKGKHGRTRNIPVADWIKGAVDAWADRARIASGPVLREAFWSEKNQRLTISETALTPQALLGIVKRHAERLGFGSVRPHDLRRTFARLAHEGGAPLKQLQLALGHSKQETTEAYVNATQDLQISPSDVLGVEV